MATFSAGNGLTFYCGSPVVQGANANMVEVTDYFQLGGGYQNQVGTKPNGDPIYNTVMNQYRTKIKLVLPSKSKITVNLVFDGTPYLNQFMGGISKTNIDVIGHICDSGYGFNDEYLEPNIIEQVNPLASGKAGTATLAFNTEFEAGTYYIYLMCRSYSAVTSLYYAKGIIASTTVDAEVLSTPMYIDNGSSWVPYEIYIDNGSSWDLYQAYVDNGSSWVPY